MIAPSKQDPSIEIRIQREPIDVAAEYAAVNAPQSGGRVVFTGCVRPEESGFVIEHLDYAAVAYGRLSDYPLPAPVEPGLLADVLPTREFRNIVTQKWIIMTDLLDQFQLQLERNTDIEALIEARLSD